MKSLVFLLLVSPLISYGQYCDSLLLQSITNPGPFTVIEIIESDGIRNGPDYNGSTIYLPVNSTNTNYSSLILVPGFMNTETTIKNWGPFLASNGIVTMTIGTNALTDTHIQRRDALLDAIISLKNENQRVGSPLFGRIDTSSIAVGGFSKGGGGAQLVPSLNPNIRAIISLYPWLDNPSANDLNHNIPVLIISGQLDAIAPPILHADVHYDLTPNTTNKLKYEVAFATHDAFSGPFGGNGDVGIRVLAWLQTFLIGDSCYCPINLQNTNTASSYVTNINCNTITNSVIQYNFPTSRKLIRIRDILGRENHIKNNELLFFIYNDGTVKKRFIIEK